MAGEIWTTSDPLMQAMHREPYRYDFFSAVRRLDRVHADRPPTGTATRPSQETIRFAQEPTLAFAPASIARFDPPRRDPDGTFHSGRLATYAIGLLGPNGPMPLAFTDYVRDRKRNHGDASPQAFLDVFHHRMIALFHRAWAAGLKAVQVERGEHDVFSPLVASVIGSSPSASEHAGPVSFETFLYYSGLLAGHSRHADGLETMLADVLGAPVRLEQFVGRWVSIPPDDRCRLGESPSCATLGATATVGSAVWDCAQTFHLRVGPMSLEDYHRLLPGSKGLRAVEALVYAYVGREFAWRVRLVLHNGDVPMTRLGQTGHLGWTTWLGDRRLIQKDVDDLVLTPAAS